MGIPSEEWGSNIYASFNCPVCGCLISQTLYNGKIIHREWHIEIDRCITLAARGMIKTIERERDG